MNQVFELPHEWILTIKNGDKKEYEGFKCGWSNSRANEELEIAKYQGQNVIGITRNISLKNGIVVIDIDENCPYQDIIRQYPFLKGTLHVKGNTKGHHIYVKYDHHKNEVDVLDGFQGDILGEKVFECEGKEWSDDPIKSITKEEFETLYKEVPKEITKVSKEQNPQSQEISTELYLMCEKLIENHLLDPEPYEIWRNVGFGIFHQFGEVGLPLFLKYSKQSDKYNEKEATKFYFSIKPHDGGITFKTIKKYAYDKNVELASKILRNYYISTSDLSDKFKCAEIISKTLKNTLILCHQKWYMLTNQLWKQQVDPTYFVIQELRKYIDYSNEKIVRQIAVTVDEKERQKLIAISESYLSHYHSHNSSSYHSVLIKFLRPLLTDDLFASKLDVTPHVLAFQNGIMDLRTMQFRHGLKSSDMLSETIPFKYQRGDSKKKPFVEDIFKKILNNNDEHADYFKRLLGYSLIGSPNLEKSIYFCIDKTENGRGDNGKTFWFNLLSDLLPNYVKETKASLLEQGNKKIHKQLAECKGKRLIWMEEFNKTKTDQDLLKRLADGNNMENEIMFGTTEIIKVMFKVFGLSNFMPIISEEACYNRYKQVSFNSHFDRTGTRTVECPEKLEFIADETLSDNLKANYVHEIMDILIESANKYYIDGLKNVPAQFKADAKETKKANDSFGTWFDDNCVLTGSIALKQLVEESGLQIEVVKDGMKRLGFKYNKDLCGLGKDKFGKFYKGGYQGCSIVENEEVTENI